MGFHPRTVQPVVSRYNNYATLHPLFDASPWDVGKSTRCSKMVFNPELVVAVSLQVLIAKWMLQWIEFKSGLSLSLIFTDFTKHPEHDIKNGYQTQANLNIWKTKHNKHSGRFSEPPLQQYCWTNVDSLRKVTDKMFRQSEAGENVWRHNWWKELHSLEGSKLISELQGYIMFMWKGKSAASGSLYKRSAW